MFWIFPHRRSKKRSTHWQSSAHMQPFHCWLSKTFLCCLWFLLYIVQAWHFTFLSYENTLLSQLDKSSAHSHPLLSLCILMSLIRWQRFWGLCIFLESGVIWTGIRIINRWANDNSMSCWGTGLNCGIMRFIEKHHRVKLLVEPLH